ncbi:MAG: RNA-binding cell elongation regulator Jag/EloR [Clostridia bacterium]
MKSIEMTGKTAEEAIQAALIKLGIAREQAIIEMIDEGSKGFLGLGMRVARVLVTAETSSNRLNDVERQITAFLYSIMEEMQIPVEISIAMKEETMHVSFSGESLGILIGRRGETLDALQYLTNLVVNKNLTERVRVVLDIENYRERREETLISLAKRLALKAKKTGRNCVLDPMNPHERRVIHTALQNDQEVETHSEGSEPYRHIVINPKNRRAKTNRFNSKPFEQASNFKNTEE